MAQLSAKTALDLPPMARVLLGIAFPYEIEICRLQGCTGSIEEWATILELVNRYASPDDPLLIEVPKSVGVLLLRDGAQRNQELKIERRIRPHKQRDEGERRIGCPRELTPEIMTLLIHASDQWAANIRRRLGNSPRIKRSH